MITALSRCAPSARRLGVFTLLLLSTAPAFGQAQFEVIAKAQPDEFYLSLGGPYIKFGEQTPDQVGIPRTNQDYLWGMATDGRFVWCGTGGNAAAQAAGEISGLFDLTPEPEELRSGKGVPYRVWEYGASQYPHQRSDHPAALGDWRPPQIFQYDAKLKKMVDRTPDDPRIKTTLGLRSAGLSNGVVILAGPSLYQIGICLFAFDAQTGNYLGSRYIFQYTNIRRWANVDGELYTSVMNTDQAESRGSVLKWTGNRLAPFNFEVVGELDNEGAYVVGHDGRLFVGTWQSVSPYAYLQGQQPEIPPLAGIWMSPKIPRGGLNRLYAKRWDKVWTPARYEPDDILAYGYSLGAMESYGGHLYFGTLHYPAVGYLAFITGYGFVPPSPSSNAERKPIILRGSGFNSSSQPTFELLYGNANEPKFQPNEMGGGTWVSTPNRTSGVVGIYGTRAFGNSNNQYTWSAQVHGGQLYFGMYDTTGMSRIDNVIDGNIRSGDGGDLWAFPQHGSPAVAASLNGCGNQGSHGVRNMVSTPYGLFLGMANSNNLLTDPARGRLVGGWELLRLVE